MSLLLAIQAYPGDLDTALEVVKLIADIEKQNRAKGLPEADVEFLFSMRFDCKIDTQRFIVAQKMIESLWKTHVLLGRRRETGWPDGCNSVWHETMMWSREKCLGRIAKWEAVLTFESDSVPLTADWIPKLQDEWAKAKSSIPKPIAVGCLLTDPPHINGNALWNSMLLQNEPKLSLTPHERSWDVFHARTIVGKSMHSPLIVSRHNTKAIDDKTLYAPLYEKDADTLPVFHHGCKNSDARDIVRKKLNL